MPFSPPKPKIAVTGGDPYPTDEKSFGDLVTAFPIPSGATFCYIYACKSSAVVALRFMSSAGVFLTNSLESAPVLVFFSGVTGKELHDEALKEGWGYGVIATQDFAVRVPSGSQNAVVDGQYLFTSTGRDGSSEEVVHYVLTWPVLSKRAIIGNLLIA